MEKCRASVFTTAEQQLLMELYDEQKEIIRKKGNTSAVIKEREKAWQTIADRLNATNLSGQRRTWQQVKIKNKNILQTAVKKKAHTTGTGGGPPSQDMTPSEELALHLNKGRPVMEGIPGGTVTDCVPAMATYRFIQVSGNTVTLLEPPEDDLGEGTSAAAGCTSADEETLSLDSRLENSQTVRTLYVKHLERQIELAEVKIQIKKRQLKDMDLESSIKRKTLRKLDLEIEKLEREVPDK